VYYICKTKQKIMVEKMKKTKSPTGKGESTWGKKRVLLYLTLEQHQALKAHAKRLCEERGRYVSATGVIREYLDGLQA